MPLFWQRLVVYLYLHITVVVAILLFYSPMRRHQNCVIVLSKQTMYYVLSSVFEEN
jgi:hypothetical protein